MSVFISGGGFTYEFQSTAGKWTWKITANNIANSGQYYYVDDINTPFGPIYSVNTPIPSDIISAMNDSLATFQQQLLPVLNLVSPNSENVTVTEGDINLVLDPITVSNTGALGSFLSASFTSSANYLLVNPSVIRGINKNAQSSATITLKPSDLLSINSPYSATINIQNTSNLLSVIPVSYTITVLPRPEITLSVYTLTFTYNLATSVGSGPMVLDVINSGPLTSVLNAYLAKVQNRSPWLSFIPSTVGPLDSGDSDSVMFSLNTSGVPAISGTYSETITFNSTTASNNPVVLTVNLVVS